MNEFIIKDKLTLRQFAITQATMAITSASILSKEPYDVNNHLAIAKAVEQYVAGDCKLPEQAEDKTEKWYEEFIKPLRTAIPGDDTKPANFTVNHK